jgi:hypothetical protein
MPRKLTYDQAKERFAEKGYELLTKIYINSSQRLLYLILVIIF